MKRLFSAIAFIIAMQCSIFAQAPGSAPVYPVGLDSRGSFLAGSNRANSTIANLGGISAGASSVSVASNPTLFPVDGGAITIDNEIIYYTIRVGSALNGLLRGQDGTTVASHNFGATISMKIIAQHVNGHSDALIEVERKLGTGADVAAVNEFLIGTGPGATAYSPLTSLHVTTALGYIPLAGPLTSGNITTALGFTPVTNARQITTTAPLSGGGALSSDLSLTIADASASVSGVVNTTTQSFAGQKTVTSPLTFLATTIDDAAWAGKGGAPYLFRGNHSQADTATPGIGGELSFAIQSTRSGGAIGNASVIGGVGFTGTGLNDLYGLYVKGLETANLSSVTGSVNVHGFRSLVIGSPAGLGVNAALNLYPIWAQGEFTVPGVNTATIQADTNNSSGSDAPSDVNTPGRSITLVFDHGPGHHNTVDILSGGTAETAPFRGWDVQPNVYSQVVLNYSRSTYVPQGTINVTASNSLVTGTSGIAAQTLTSLTSSGTTATATKSSHGFSTGNRITIAGATPTTYNGIYVITVTGANTFTYTIATTATSPATGTITATRVGTKFLTEYIVGGQVNIAGTYYTVATITDNNNLNVTPVYAGSTASNLIPTIAVAPIWMTNNSYAMAFNDAGTSSYRAFGLAKDGVWNFDPDGRKIRVGTNLTANSNFTNLVTIGAVGGSEAFPGIWLGPATPTLSNAAILYDTNKTIINATSEVDFRIGNASAWEIDSSKNLIVTATDNTVDVGGIVTNRPRTGNFGTSVIAPVGTFATSVSSPLIIGGTSTTASLTLKASSGAATGGANIFMNPVTSGVLPGAVYIGAPVTSNINASGLTDVLHLQGPDASLTVVTLDAYGSGASGTGSALVFRQANGTAASPTETLATNTVAGFGGRPFYTRNAAGIAQTPAFTTGNRATITFKAAQDIKSDAQGMYITFETTPKDDTARAERWRVEHGGWFVGKELSTNPTTSELAAGDQISMYRKADKLIFAYNNGGTITYLVFDLTAGTGVGKTYEITTVAP